MKNKAYWPGSFANNNPCIQAFLTKKEARKNDMFVMRYAALGLGHVVVAPATFSDSTCPHDVDNRQYVDTGNVVSTYCQHFGLGQYRIRHGGVSDMLPGIFYIYF